MRIKREHLLSAARNCVAERVRFNRRIISVYLTGSLLGEDYLLGGSADIDLVFVHDEPIEPGREIVPLNDDISFDIANLPLKIFQQPRSLRVDAWIGPFFCLNPLCLHDTQHWFEFTQASLCSQFHRPENVLQRARSQAELARQGWMSLVNNTPWNPSKALVYLKSLENAANALALLSGPPLTERRLMLQFGQRAAAIQRPGMASGLLDLFTPGEPLAPTVMNDWMGAWTQALEASAKSSDHPQRLSACRLPYYIKAVEVQITDYPESALWTMLRTWTMAMCSLSAEPAAHLPAWNQLCQTLHLDVEHVEERLEGLDRYLDTAEEILDDQAKIYGI